MYKVGDKVIMIRDYGGLKVGDIITLKAHWDSKLAFLPLPKFDNNKEGIYPSIYNDPFRKYKNELHTEIDYLNAFQDNFKEGV